MQDAIDFAVPMHLHPDTKDKWIYLAGPIAIRKMIENGCGAPDLAKKPFCALGVTAIQHLQIKELLQPLMDAGDIALLRVEATDG
jgi:hypothetical protein